MTRCALCRTVVSLPSLKHVVDGEMYHAGCWARKVRQAVEGKIREARAAVTADPPESRRAEGAAPESRPADA
jgi:hypothetical protein